MYVQRTHGLMIFMFHEFRGVCDHHPSHSVESTGTHCHENYNESHKIYSYIYSLVSYYYYYNISFGFIIFSFNVHFVYVGHFGGAKNSNIININFVICELRIGIYMAE